MRRSVLRRVLPVILLFWSLAFGQNSTKKLHHRDYVPDEKTAERIAEAALIAQFGQERVNAQLPLHASSTSNDNWLVQGVLKDKEGRTQVGGAFGVWVNKHSGCLSVMEHMK